ncbi:MAG TPA: hypothetical protein VNJ02_15880 [Vicinamibacterales bacterium]|nr:hypothetical protein [Vicinamibacterales bacterium]
MRSLRQDLLTAVIVAALIAGTSLSVCTGWAPSAEARMACCDMAGHDCAEEHADDCCAAGEQRQHAESAVTLTNFSPQGLLAILPNLAPLAADPVIARAWRPRQHPPDTPRSSADARLLLSVFLL